MQTKMLRRNRKTKKVGKMKTCGQRICTFTRCITSLPFLVLSLTQAVMQALPRPLLLFFLPPPRLLPRVLLHLLPAGQLDLAQQAVDVEPHLQLL